MVTQAEDRVCLNISYRIYLNSFYGFYYKCKKKKFKSKIRRYFIWNFYIYSMFRYTFIYTVSIDILISRVNKYALPDTLYKLFSLSHSVDPTGAIVYPNVWPHTSYMSLQHFTNMDSQVIVIKQLKVYLPPGQRQIHTVQMIKWKKADLCRPRGQLGNGGSYNHLGNNWKPHNPLGNGGSLKA